MTGFNRMARPYCWMVVIFVILAAGSSFAEVAIAVQIGPPALPVYRQPICPAADYIWTPGYWAWSGDGYYWVPGTWVLAPEPGYLWTPGYWAFSDGFYRWHPGYWGLKVGFYGGIDYGYGYFGSGYYGGRWRNGHFYYNREVNNVNVTHTRYVYDQRVPKVRVTHVSHNGGPGGTAARPTAAQVAAERGHHIAATRMQAEHEQQAKANRQQFASVNHGRPPVTATPKAGELKTSPPGANGAATSKPAPHPTKRTASKAVPRTAAPENKREPARATNNESHPERQSPARSNEHAQQEPRRSNGTAHNGTPPARMEQKKAQPGTRQQESTVHPPEPARKEAVKPAPGPKASARATPPHEAAPPHTAPAPHEARPPKPKNEEKKPPK